VKLGIDFKEDDRPLGTHLSKWRQSILPKKVLCVPSQSHLFPCPQTLRNNHPDEYVNLSFPFSFTTYIFNTQCYFIQFFRFQCYVMDVSSALSCNISLTMLCFTVHLHSGLKSSLIVITG
jgi:hypothetical protein